MIAQVTLTPTESKKLIAKGLLKLDIVKQALERGMLVLHPSSSTFFILEEITGSPPPSEVWVCGAVFPKGPCSDLRAYLAMREFRQECELDSNRDNSFPFSWVLRRGKLEMGITLGALLAEMGPGDVYVKGVNALDAEGHVGVLYANVSPPGGVFGRVIPASRKNGFKLVFPAGLEKLIATPIREAARAARPRDLDYSMGYRVGLMPCEGTVVTELDAIKIMSGAKANHIASGGLGGAEGAVTLVIGGNNEQVDEAVRLVCTVKGASLPPLQETDCAHCDREGCSLVRGHT